jgi:hypothetical protein
MATFWRGIRVAAAMALLAAGAVAAQGTPRGLVLVRDEGRRGFWIGGGLGRGGETLDLRDGAGYSEELHGPTVSLHLGGTPSQHLRLGGEILAWFHDEGLVGESLSSFLFVGQVYPIKSTGLYLKGGLGVGRSEVDFGAGERYGDTGFAGLVGAGWEIRVGRRLYLNPVANLVEHRYDLEGGDNYRERMVNLGIGILYQSGR